MFLGHPQMSFRFLVLCLEFSYLQGNMTKLPHKLILNLKAAPAVLLWWVQHIISVVRHFSK